jgi:two-component system, NtrC family, nitrogen regulation response regulator NtrX
MTSTIETTDKPERILVEDDEETLREIMTHMLTAAGYECRGAETPTKTLEILDSEERIDLVCCGVTEWADNSFKSMIGTTASRTIPVIVSTASFDISLMTKVLGMGCYDFVFRPFTAEQLVFAVRRALQHRRLKLENLYFRDRLGLGSGIEIPLNLLVGGSMDK